jgi:hypothetical protein
VYGMSTKLNPGVVNLQHPPMHFERWICASLTV